MHMQAPNSYIAEEASDGAVSLVQGALHPFFAASSNTSDDCMYTEEGDEYEPTDSEGEPQQSQEVQRPRVAVGLPEAPPLPFLNHLLCQLAVA